MHKYQDNIDWVNRTIVKVTPIKNSAGFIEEIEILFADGWTTRIWAQGNIIGVVTGPH